MRKRKKIRQLYEQIRDDCYISICIIKERKNKKDRNLEAYNKINRLIRIQIPRIDRNY